MSNHQNEWESVEAESQREPTREHARASGSQSTRRGFVRRGLFKAAYMVPAVATLAAPTSVFAASGGGPSCGSVDAVCVTVTDCCANMDCTGMGTKKCCGAVNFACTADADCCGMGTCAMNKCDGM